MTTDDTTTLALCPFCGGVVHELYASGPVCCRYCGAVGPYPRDRMTAADLWGRRAGEERERVLARADTAEAQRAAYRLEGAMRSATTELYTLRAEVDRLRAELAQARADGAAAERTAVVGYLREWAEGSGGTWTASAAEEIEAGEHIHTNTQPETTP